MKLTYFFLIFCIVSCITLEKTSAQGLSINFQFFYDELSPYGTWVNTPNYGYAWQPDVSDGFMPYATDGFWLFTDDGWTWVSDFTWGWAPFHYGRWYTDPYYGPMWVPDYEWGPGWVTWRRSNDYYGWAPIGPGISFNIAFGRDYNERHNRYTFIRGGYFGRRDMYQHYENHSHNDTYFNNSTTIYNPREDPRRHTTYNAGPDRLEIEKHIGTTIIPVPIREINRPGQTLSNDQLQIYRPQVQKHESNGPRPEPSKVQSIKNLKPREQRNIITPSLKENPPTIDQPLIQPDRKQPVKQQQPNVQPNKKQPVKQQQQQPNVQPDRKQPVKQQQPNVQPDKKQPAPQQQQQPNVQPDRKQPVKQQQQQPNVQPLPAPHVHGVLHRRQLQRRDRFDPVHGAVGGVSLSDLVVSHLACQIAFDHEHDLLR